MGVDAGVKEVCAEFGLTWVPDIKLSDKGTPFLNSIWETADKLAENPFILYCSADMLLTQSTITTLVALKKQRSSFLGGVRRQEWVNPHAIDFNNSDWASGINSVMGSPHTGDYFVYPRGYFGNDMPPFLQGRSQCDNWFYWYGWQKDELIDISECCTAYHQSHKQGHKANSEFAVNANLARNKMKRIGQSNWVMLQIQSLCNGIMKRDYSIVRRRIVSMVIGEP
jgi:hypothetical protein